MTYERPRSPLRLLAPVALVVFTLAFLVVLTSSGVEDEGAGSETSQSQRQETSGSDRQGTTTERERARRPATYTVQVGDTLAGIAAKTGLTVEQLQELNPEIDPQALVSGQELKLRE